MGLQDAMAVVASGRAIEASGLSSPLGERVGLFIVVGHIPFEEAQIEPVTSRSVVDGEFSMGRFSTEALRAVRPLVTFRCLPNMPAYHVSACFDIQGPYAVLYPGPAQSYLALEQAVLALQAGRVTAALWGGVAHRRNFLVEHHFRRLEPDREPELEDAAAFAVLETEAGARARGARIVARLAEHRVSYVPHDPLEEGFALVQRLSRDGGGLEATPDLGPATLATALALGGVGVRYELRSRDGFVASSRWEPA